MLEFDKAVIANGPFRVSADWSVAPGSRIALIGPSGAGKTTILSAIAGFLPVVAGALRWQGRDLAPLPPGDRPVSILFQDENLFPHLTVAQNVGLGLRPALRLNAAERARVSAALARVGLAGFDTRLPAELSGGQQSRVALARVLLRARPLLLLDEPFAALGPALKASMLDLVAEICDETGATLFMVSHDPEDARRICPLTALVVEGRAAPPVPTGPLLDAPPPALAAYLGT